MSWSVEFTKAARKDIRALDPVVRKRIEGAIRSKLVIDPKAHLAPLSGELRGLGKFRVGPYRLICKLEEDRLLILVLKLGARGSVYRKR